MTISQRSPIPVRLLASLVLLLFLAAQGPSWSAEVVHFQSAVLAPNSAKVNRATTGGRDSAHEPGFPIWGYIAKPAGDGPFPAVVLVHGCAGIVWNYIRWASLLNDMGYVTLVLDSFRPRSIISTCANPVRSAGPEARALDAHGALAYLGRLPFIDAGRIAVVGWSAGGIAALGAVATSGVMVHLPTRFRAVVAFYPYCIGGRNFDLPVLILMGDADDWTPVAPCRMLEDRNRKSGTVELIAYPGARHAFDWPELASGLTIKGADGRRHFLQYDKTAHEDAKSRIRVFLAKHLIAE